MWKEIFFAFNGEDTHHGNGSRCALFAEVAIFTEGNSLVGLESFEAVLFFFVAQMPYFCRKPPSYVPYKCTYVPYDSTFGASDQGQTLDV